MKKILLSAIAAILLSSCSSFGPKPHVLYERKDIKQDVAKIIIFPTTDFNGKVSDGAKAVNTSIIASWGGIYGSKNVIPAGMVIEKMINGSSKDAYGKFIKTLDGVSSIEQLTKNPAFKKLVSEVVSKVGNHQFALAIISGGEKEFNNNAPIALHIGLFDSANMTWRIITKIETTKSAISNWKVDSQLMVKNSFDVIAKSPAAKPQK